MQMPWSGPIDEFRVPTGSSWSGCAGAHPPVPMSPTAPPRSCPNLGSSATPPGASTASSPGTVSANQSEIRRIGLGGQEEHHLYRMEIEGRPGSTTTRPVASGACRIQVFVPFKVIGLGSGAGSTDANDITCHGVTNPFTCPDLGDPAWSRSRRRGGGAGGLPRHGRGSSAAPDGCPGCAPPPGRLRRCRTQPAP